MTRKWLGARLTPRPVSQALPGWWQMRTRRLRTGLGRTGCSPQVVVYWPHRAPARGPAPPNRAGPRRGCCRITPVARPRPLVLGCGRSRWPVGVARRRSEAAHGKDPLTVRGPAGCLSMIPAREIWAGAACRPGVFSRPLGSPRTFVIIATFTDVPRRGKAPLEGWPTRCAGDRPIRHGGHRRRRRWPSSMAGPAEWSVSARAGGWLADCTRRG